MVLLAEVTEVTEVTVSIRLATKTVITFEDSRFIKVCYEKVFRLEELNNFLITNFCLKRLPSKVTKVFSVASGVHPA